MLFIIISVSLSFHKKRIQVKQLTCKVKEILAVVQENNTSNTEKEDGIANNVLLG